MKLIYCLSSFIILMSCQYFYRCVTDLNGNDETSSVQEIGATALLPCFIIWANKLTTLVHPFSHCNHQTISLRGIYSDCYIGYATTVRIKFLLLIISRAIVSLLFILSTGILFSLHSMLPLLN
jgi:hypothetical protein